MVPRLAFALALAAALLVPGCVQQETPASTASTSASAAPDVRPELKDLKVLPDVKLGVAQIGAEPNIAAAPDGTLYVTTPLYLWRSDDSGKSWKALGSDACDTGLIPTPLGCPPGFEKKDPGLDGGGDGDIAIDANGSIYWAGLSGSSGPIPFQASTDKGVTWTKPVDLSNKTGSDREWIDAWGNGHVVVDWRDTKDGGKLAFRHSVDGGKTWDSLQYWESDHVAGPIVHDPSSSSIYVPYIDDGKGIVVARTDDFGHNWTKVLAAPISRTLLLGFPTSIFPVAAVDSAGTVYLVYASDDTLPDNVPVKAANRAVVHLLVSKDKGATWSKPVVVSPEGNTALFPWVAAGKPGRIAIAWYEGTLGAPNEVAPDLWNVHLVESATGDAEKPTWKGALLNSQPTHIGTICTDGLLCSLTGRDRSLLDFFEVTIAPDGQPHATWSGDANERMLSATVYAGGLSDGAALR